MMAKVTHKINEKALPINAIIAAAKRAVNATLEKVDGEYKDSVSTFTHKPTFHKQRAQHSHGVVRAREWTTDENYVRLNYDTTPHMTNKPIGSVVYMGYGYRKKTRPGRIRATTGSYTGHHFRTKTAKWRPSSFPGRHFDLTIKRHNDPFLRRVVELELRKIK